MVIKSSSKVLSGHGEMEEGQGRKVQYTITSSSVTEEKNFFKSLPQMQSRYFILVNHLCIDEPVYKIQQFQLISASLTLLGKHDSSARESVSYWPGWGLVRSQEHIRDFPFTRLDLLLLE